MKVETRRLASTRIRLAVRDTAIDWGKWLLILVAIAFLALILFIPALNVFVQAFNSTLR